MKAAQKIMQKLTGDRLERYRASVEKMRYDAVSAENQELREQISYLKIELRKANRIIESLKEGIK